jgi:transcriptional regulator with XRE-family HTH domain
LGNTRRALGISCRELGRRTALGPQRIARAERGEVDALTIDVAARIAPALGLQLAVSLHPNGDPVRDKGHLALIDRLRRRLPRLALHVEVPIPIVGDILVEAETHLGDIQLIERRAAAKARDLSALHTILLVADTRHNVQVINEHPELRERFPVDGGTCLARLVNGVDPGGDALVIL